MAKININYKDALTQYPQHVSEVEQKIRGGKSKHKTDNFNTFNWYIDFGVQIEGESIQDILSGKRAQAEQERLQLTINERVDEYMTRVFATLAAGKGRGSWQSDAVISNCIEIRANAEQQEREDDAELKRLSELTSTERQTEVNDLIKELSGDGTTGFFALNKK